MKVNRSDIKKLAVLLVISLLTTIINAYGQDDAIDLYVSAETRQASSFSGNYSAQTDSTTFGHLSITASGPVIFNTDKDDLTANPNQNISWSGRVTVNMNAIPTPGTTESGTLYGYYNYNFSRAYGTGVDGIVQHTYFCDGVNCPVHGNMKGIHEAVADSGTDALHFNIVSIMADLPDTLIIDPATLTGKFTAVCYPANKGTYKWWCNDPGVKINNADKQTATIAIAGNLNSFPVIHMTYDVAGIQYTALSVLITGACTCNSFNKLLTVGPLSVNINDNRHKNVTSPDAAHCVYTIQAPAFSLNMTGLLTRQLAVNAGNTSLKFSKDCSNNSYKDLDLNWEGNVALEGYKIGNVENALQLTATRAHLYTTENGNLEGTVTLHATFKELDLTGNGTYILRKTESDIPYDINKGIDLTQLKGIEIDLVKQGTAGNAVIAYFKGDPDKNGVLTGSIKASNSRYISNQFQILMTDLEQDFKLQITNGLFTLGNATGDIQVSGITALSGSATFHFDATAGSGMFTNSKRADLSAFGMKLNNIVLAADMDRDYDLMAIAGKATAQHPDWSAPLNVAYLKAQNGALTTFNASGSVAYKGFTFYLLRSAYSEQNKMLTFTATMELELANAGTRQMVGVNQFGLDGTGKIAISGIQGSINHAPAAFDFTAAFTNDHFAGSFNGAYGSLPIDGTITIYPSVNYDYAILGLQSKQKQPLGNSGLYLSSLTGAIGLNFEFTSPNYSGQPKQGSYQLALETTVQDDGGLIKASGSGILPFSTDPILGIKGMINGLPNNAVFAGTVNVDYHLNQQSVEGSLASPIKIGSTQQFLNTDACDLHFTIGGEKWTAVGTAISGKIFNSLQLVNSAIDMTGNLTQPNTLAGMVRGTLKGEYQYAISFPVDEGNTNSGMVTGIVTFTFNNPIHAPFDENGLTEPINTTVNGTDSLTLDIPGLGLHQTFISTTTANGQITNRNGTTHFEGTLDIVLGNNTYHKPLNIAF